jgi:hypothetical protein
MPDTKGESQAPEKTQTKTSEPRPTKYLPTDRIGFARQLDLLRAWASASGPSGKPVLQKDVASIVDMSASTPSLAVPFFIENGFLTRGDAGYTPAPDVVAFSRAYEWNPEASSHKLRPLLTETWFCRALMPKLGFGPLSEEEAIQRLAEACAAATKYRPQLRILLDYLQAGGIVQIEGGVVRKAGIASSSEPERPAPAPAAIEQRESPKAAVTTSFIQPTEGVVQFHVSVKVDMTEFAGWRPERIAAFFGGIASVLAAKSQVEKEASG